MSCVPVIKGYSDYPIMAPAFPPPNGGHFDYVRSYYNFLCQLYYAQHPHRLTTLDGLEPAKKRKRAETLPSLPATTNLIKENPTPGKLGLISFRPQDDLASKNRASCVVVGSKRRHDGVRVPTSRMSCRKSHSFSGCSPLIRGSGGSSSKPASADKIERILTVTDEDELMTTTIRHVLPECLVRVFSYLDVTSKGRAAQVCRYWRDVCYEKSVWRGVEAKLHLKKSNPTLYPSLVRRGITRVQVLSLKKSLRELIHGIPNLQSLNLAGCYSLSDGNLDSAFNKGVPALKSLNLSLCKDVSDNSIGKIASRCKNLERLDLGGCSKISNNALFYISSNLKNMKSLNLRSCRQVSDQGLCHLTGKNSHSNPAGLERLENLGLQDCQKITDEGLQSISAGLPKVSKINLSFCVSVTDTGLKSLGRISTLEDLNLRSCDNISDIGIGFLAEDVGGRNLKHLDTCFCPNVTDAAAKHVAAGMPGLKELSMANCAVSDEGILKIAKSNKKLQSLNIGQCKSVTDKSLRVLVKELKALKSIDLYGCSNASSGVIEQIRQMPKITDLNLQLHTN